MYPPIYTVVTGYAPAAALIATRFYPFAEAPQAVDKPYAVWQRVGGSPENYLGDRPDIDAYSLQVDCYAKTASQARAIADAIRDAIEGQSYITRWGAEEKEQETGLYRVSFDVSWWVNR